MAKGNHRPGGGIKSRTVVHKPVRTGAAREHIQKAAVAQIGQRQGDHVTNRAGSTGYRGESLIGPKSPISEPMGNEIAVATKCGPGGSREVMRTGSQGVHGSPNPGNPTPAGEIFPGFGPRK
jgi:hypothetical protein